MTTVFDALSRIVWKYREANKITPEDANILRTAIDVMHDLQHKANNHDIDNWIAQRIIHKERFEDWCYDRVTLLEEKRE